MGKFLHWLQERVKRWTKNRHTAPFDSWTCVGYFVHGRKCIISICIKKKKCNDIVVLTDLGLHSSDMSYKIAGSYKDAR